MAQLGFRESATATNPSAGGVLRPALVTPVAGSPIAAGSQLAVVPMRVVEWAALELRPFREEALAVPRARQRVTLAYLTFATRRSLRLSATRWGRCASADGVVHSIVRRRAEVTREGDSPFTARERRL